MELNNVFVLFYLRLDKELNTFLTYFFNLYLMWDYESLKYTNQNQ